MHYETIHNRVSSTYDMCKTTRVINELGHHIKVIEGKADLHSCALKELTIAQQKDINELNRNFTDLTNMVHHLRNRDIDIEKELICQRALIQNMEQMHRQEFNDLKKSLSEIRSLISDLTKVVSPSPPEACKIAINGCTADSGFSGGLGSIPEDDFDSEINSEFGLLGLEENCTKL
jgi:predicted  nucleic acid-binding Zn-ribbon protein